MDFFRRKKKVTYKLFDKDGGIAYSVLLTVPKNTDEATIAALGLRKLLILNEGVSGCVVDNVKLEDAVINGVFVDVDFTSCDFRNITGDIALVGCSFKDSLLREVTSTSVMVRTTFTDSVLLKTTFTSESSTVSYVNCELTGCDIPIRNKTSTLGELYAQAGLKKLTTRWSRKRYTALYVNCKLHESGNVSKTLNNSWFSNTTSHAEVPKYKNDGGEIRNFTLRVGKVTTVICLEHRGVKPPYVTINGLRMPLSEWLCLDHRMIVRHDFGLPLVGVLFWAKWHEMIYAALLDYIRPTVKDHIDKNIDGNPWSGDTIKPSRFSRYD